MTSTIRTFTKLVQHKTHRERYNYLRLRSEVGVATFGFDRYMNQQFYQSAEWRQVRHHVIARDEGCDLALPGYEIYDRIYIHHMNPMTIADIEQGNPDILDPEFLISVTLQTHNAIHYGDASLLPKPPVVRRPGDTKLWLGVPMNFGDALAAVKNNERLSRSGWNGKGMFIYLVPGSTFEVNRPPLLGIYQEGTQINYLPHIDMKTADGSCVPWLASQADILAEDWLVVTP